MFWLHGEDLPPGVGSEAFCAAHIAYLLVFLTLAICYTLLYKSMDERRRKTADRILGSLVFFFALCEYGVTAIIGRFSLYTLPIHVCSLMFTLALLHAWTNDARPGSFAAKLHRFLGAVVFHPGMLGTLAALLFPDWLNYPFWNYLSISSFLAHGFLFVYGASILVNIKEARDPRGLFRLDLRNSALFLGLGALLTGLFNRATGTNYWFVARPSQGSPFTDAYESGGYGGYLFAFALTVLAVTALWYGLRFCLYVRGRKP